MYTILMKDDKSLVATIKTTLNQGENLVDKIQILCPEFYEDLDIKKCTVYLKYVNQGNVLHNEILQMDNELYNGKVRFVLPVNTGLTQFAGVIYISLLFKYSDEKTKLNHVLYSGETKLEINPVSIRFQTDLNPDSSGDNNSGADDNNDGGSETDNPDSEEDDEEGFDSVEF